MGVSERFDILFEGMPEEKELLLLQTDPDDLSSNPVDKYIAATKLAACRSERSLEGLIAAVQLDPETLSTESHVGKHLKRLDEEKTREPSRAYSAHCISTMNPR